MLKLILIILLNTWSSFDGTTAKVAPDYIQTCPGLKSDCLKKTFQETLPFFAKGIPELGIEPIDPLRQEKIKMELPGGFQVDFTNGTLTGLRKCAIDSASYKPGEASLKIHCDLTIKGQYKANGRILIVSINGDGDARIKLRNFIIDAKIKLHDVVRDGVTYYEVKSYDFKQSYGDRVSFSLTNLFKGNPELSEAVLQFLNQNWKQVAEEFGDPLVTRLVGVVFNIIKKFFAAIPKDELFVN